MKKRSLVPALIMAMALTGCALGNNTGSNPLEPSAPSSQTPSPSSVDSSTLDVGKTINDTMTDLLLEDGVHLTADIDKINISSSYYESEYSKFVTKQEISGNADLKFNGLKEKNIDNFTGEAHLSDVDITATRQFIENHLVIEEETVGGSSMSANAYLKENNLYFDFNQNVLDFISTYAGQKLPFNATDKFYYNNIFGDIALDNNLSSYAIFGLNYIDLANDDLYLDFIDEIYLTGTMYNFKMDFDTEEFVNKYVEHLLEYESIREDQVDTYIAMYTDMLNIDAEIILGLDLENKNMMLDVDCEVSVVAPYQEISYDVDVTLTMQFGEQTINYPNLSEYNVDFTNPQ